MTPIAGEGIAIPDTLGDYKVLERLGEGGIGEVFRARDTRHGRTVAIKVVREELLKDHESRDRMLADARAAAKLSHPNIAALFDVCDDSAVPFVVSEFVDGDRLDALISGTPINTRRAVDLGLQMADALAEAHGRGVLHRDLRPENVIVTRKGQAKLIDTGLAAWTRGGAARDGAPGQVAAAPAVAHATAPYLAPEQALGMVGDERTDIYCLGALIYTMIGGRAPFTGASPVDITFQVLQAQPAAPRTWNPSIPEQLEKLVLRMLAKAPGTRPASAAIVAAALREIAESLEETPQENALTAAIDAEAPRGGARSWTWWIAGAAGAVACLLAWLWSR